MLMHFLVAHFEVPERGIEVIVKRVVGIDWVVLWHDVVICGALGQRQRYVVEVVVVLIAFLPLWWRGCRLVYLRQKQLLQRVQVCIFLLWFDCHW